MMDRALVRIAVLACLASLGAAIYSSTDGSISVSYAEANGNATGGSLDLPLNVMGRVVPGAAPDQVHIIYWGNNSYLISWATGDGQVGPGVVPPPADSVKSMVMISTDPNMTNANMTMNATGIQLTYLYDYSADVFPGYLGNDYANLPGPLFLTVNYASPVLHHVLVEGLMPNTTYYYKVGDPRFFYGMSKVYNFSTPLGPKANGEPNYPFTLGIMADVGQTSNTTSMQARMMKAKMDAVALIGDFTYADNYGADGCLYYDYRGVDPDGLCPMSYPEGATGEQTYQPRWDTWGRLWEPVLSHIPLMFSNGNHELEELPTGARFTSLNARYPGPPAAGLYDSLFQNFTNQMYLKTIVQAQVMDDEFDLMGANHNMFYSVEMGPATMIYITSFIGSDNFAKTTAQYVWLENTLKAVNRTRTPWVIVNFHFPMYSSFVGPYKGNECFRLSFEPLMYEYGVDVVFNGHVHSYERTNPVYNLTLDNCGPVHIIVGDGGNNEGAETATIDMFADKLKYCQPGNETTRGFPVYQPQACYPLNPDGSYCDFKQPVWSAYRNPSWGFGVLTIMNSTTAHWLWNNTDNGSTEFDEVYLTRNLACPSVFLSHMTA